MHWCNCGKFGVVKQNIQGISAIFQEIQQSSFQKFLSCLRNVTFLSCAVKVLMLIAMQRYIRIFVCEEKSCANGFSIWNYTIHLFVHREYEWIIQCSINCLRMDLSMTDYELWNTKH